MDLAVYWDVKHQIKQIKWSAPFVFATWIVQYLYFLNTKFQASSHLQWLYSLVWVRPGQKPHCWFFHVSAQMLLLIRHYVHVCRLLALTRFLLFLDCTNVPYMVLDVMICHFIKFYIVCFISELRVTCLKHLVVKENQQPGFSLSLKKWRFHP